MWNVMFFVNSALLGVGLAMDAFSISLANGLQEPQMKKPRQVGIASVYAIFQFLMPMVGWICVHTIVETFKAFEKAIPWIALALLAYIGGKMVYEGIRDRKKPQEEVTHKALTFGVLLVQGIATSIDALSVGFTIADYNTLMAIVASLIIAVVTFMICFIGLTIGKKVGEKLSWKASILGGCILIAIGLEIFITGVFNL